MAAHYNVSVKVLDSSKEWMIQSSLTGYRVFRDRSGNLDRTCFSRENVPYVGELIVVKTLKKEAAEIAHQVLSAIEGLVVLPINESVLESENVFRFNKK